MSSFPVRWILVPLGSDGRHIVSKEELTAVASTGQTPEKRLEWSALGARTGWGLLTGPMSRAWVGPEEGAAWRIHGPSGVVSYVHSGFAPPAGVPRKIGVVAVERVESLTSQETTSWGDAAWPEDPLDVDLDLAGPGLASIARGWSQIFGVTPTAALLCALGSFSAALMGRVEINCGGGWWERNPALWVLIAMPSGHRKTPLLEAALRPWQTVTARLREEHLRSVAIHRLDQARAKRELDEAIREGDEDAALCAQEILCKPDPPKDPSIVVDSYTPEALAENFSQKPALFLALGEAKRLFLEAMRGDHINMGVLLDAYSGAIPRATLRIGRVQMSSGRARARAGLLGLMQPSVFYGVAKHPEFMSEGLLGRALWTVTQQPAAGDRERRQSLDVGLHEALESAWASLLDRALSIPQIARGVEGEDAGDPLVWSFSERSELALLTYADRCKELGSVGGRLRDLETWLLKAHGQAARLAATLACADGHQEGRIPDRYVDCAIGLLMQLEAHTEAVWRLAGWPPETDDARHLWACTRHLDRDVDHPRGTWDSTHGKISDWGPERVGKALKALAGRGFVRISDGGIRLHPTAF